MPPTPQNVLRFARQLADLDSHLEWLTYGHQCPNGCNGMFRPVVASYRLLLDLLVTEHATVEAVAGAVDEFRTQRDAAEERRDAAHARWQAAHDEAERRHDLALTVECPYCGAAPGDVCRTAGPTGRRYSKGSADHKDRYRAATHLTASRDSTVDSTADGPDDQG